MDSQTLEVTPVSTQEEQRELECTFGRKFERPNCTEQSTPDARAAKKRASRLNPWIY
jgi:hypothetical protein